MSIRIVMLSMLTIGTLASLALPQEEKKDDESKVEIESLGQQPVELTDIRRQKKATSPIPQL